MRIAEASGGVPRFAISIARGALQMAFHNSADEVTPEHVRWSTEKFFASQFARGLEPYELDALATLALTGKINGEFSWRKMINKGAAIATDKQLRGLRAHPLLIEYFRREAA